MNVQFLTKKNRFPNTCPPPFISIENTSYQKYFTRTHKKPVL